MLDSSYFALADEKRGPLIWALLETAEKQGASISEFEQACEDACRYLKTNAMRLKTSEVTYEKETVCEAVREAVDGFIGKPRLR